MLEQQLTLPNPNPDPRNDVVEQDGQHDPTFAQVVKFLTDMTNVSMTFHSSGDYNMVTDATATVTPRREIQAARCEVCKIHCDTVDVLEKHKQGKRHKKNMQNTPVSSAARPNISESIQNGNFRQMPSCHSGVALGGDLEAKKHSLLQNGTLLESVMFCEICSVASIGQSQFDTHLAGKKHAAKVKLHANYSEAVPSVWCEICKIKCTGMDVLNNHKLGKKHLKNLEKLNKTIDPPSVASPVAISIAEPVKIPGVEGQSQIPSVASPVAISIAEPVKTSGVEGQSQIPSVASPVAISLAEPVKTPGVEGQSQIPSVASPVAISIAEPVKTPGVDGQSQISSVASPVAISIAEPVKTSGIEGQSQILQPASCTDPNLSSIVGHVVSPAASDVNAQILPASSVDAQPMEISEASGGKMPITGSLWCGICKIGCNSQETLKSHQAGRKHLKNLKNLEIPEKFIGPLPPTEAPASTPIGPMQNNLEILPEKFIGPLPPTEAPAAMEIPPQKEKKKTTKRSAASKEDLETKKRKIVQEGTSSDAVKACEICNVVCNSPTSFISHLAGKKHIAMAVKQAEAGVSVPCA